MVDKVGAYTLGNILISLVAGLGAWAALTALRVPFALPLAFLVAVTDLIPTIGATLGAVICVLVALPTTPLWPNTVLVAVYFVLYQQLENYVIVPRIMRNAIQLRPGAVLLASLIGATALGLIGALMAIPIAAGVKVLIDERLQARDEADTIQNRLTTMKEPRRPARAASTKDERDTAALAYPFCEVTPVRPKVEYCRSAEPALPWTPVRPRRWRAAS